MISSFAVARRITPLRCRLPCPSTKPFGRVNSNSVLKAISVGAPCCFLLRTLAPRALPTQPGNSRGQGFIQPSLLEMDLAHAQGLVLDVETFRRVGAVAGVEGRA